MAKRKVGTCPKCGKALVVRDGRRGKFVACTGYPSCRYTRDYVPPKATDEGCEGVQCWECPLHLTDDCHLMRAFDGRL